MRTPSAISRGLCFTLMAAASVACFGGATGCKSSAPKTELSTTSDASVQHAEHEARMGWWRDAKFGMFVHFGLYSVPAGEWPGKGTGHAEWIRDTAQIPVGDYEKLLSKFNPTKFNATEYARIAQDAGMRYLVITSKHHDGFCLFDSQQTDWDVMSTPFRRDIMKELSDACAKLGTVTPGQKVVVGSQPVRFCMYHSIMDWHQNDYLPRRPWEKAGRPEAGADFDRYIKYLKAQLAEVTGPKYDPGLIWFDGEWEPTWTRARGGDLARYMRTIAPNVIFNNRIDTGRDGLAGGTQGEHYGDYETPEQTIPEKGFPGDWETCMTINGNWGYNAADKDFKSSEDLIRKLCDIASKGGNFLLNVGPTGEGVIPPESVKILQEMGQWMRINGDAIYGTVRSPLAATPSWGRVTMKPTATGATLYLHEFVPPADGKLVLSGLLNEPGRAWLLQSPASSSISFLTAERKDGQIVIDTSSVTRGTRPVAVYAVEIIGKPDLINSPSINAASDSFLDSVDVSVASDRTDAQVRVTTDGSTPTASSPLAGAPVRLTGTSTVSARTFRDGKAVTPIVSRTFTKVTPQAAAQVAAVEPMLKLDVYEGDWDKLPDFGSLNAVKTVMTGDISTSAATRKEQYGLRYTGYFKVDTAGMYDLGLSSDDGSRLLVGGKVLIDNDGLHQSIEKRGTIALAAGWHPITIEMFQKTGGAALAVNISGPGMSKQPLAGKMLGH